MRYVWGVGGGFCGGGCCSPRRARVQNLGASVSFFMLVLNTAWKASGVAVAIFRSSPRGARFFVSPSSSRRHGRSIVPHYVCSPQALGPPGFMFFRKFSRLCKQRKFQA